MGNPWIQTYNGTQFHFLDPAPKEFNLFDIAHALAMTCRFGGHTKVFYSVAQHSVLVSHLKPGKWSLLHDAAEAYLGDMPTPIKQSLDKFDWMETRILRGVAERFNLKWPIPKVVHVADRRLLGFEVNSLMLRPTDYAPWVTTTKRLEDIFAPDLCTPWSPDRAEAEFLRRASESGLSFE